jgi:hypothetical protein
MLFFIFNTHNYAQCLRICCITHIIGIICRGTIPAVRPQFSDPLSACSCCSTMKHCYRMFVQPIRQMVQIQSGALWRRRELASKPYNWQSAWPAYNRLPVVGGGNSGEVTVGRCCFEAARAEHWWKASLVNSRTAIFIPVITVRPPARHSKAFCYCTWQTIIGIKRKT